MKGYREFPVVRGIAYLSLTAAMNAVWLGGLRAESDATWTGSKLYVPIAALLYLMAYILPDVSATGIPTKRLKRCYAGSVMLRGFLVSTAVSVMIYILMLISGDRTRKEMIVAAVVIFLGELIYFWTGIIMVYLTSVQLGIDKRVIGLLCGMIPVAHLGALSMITRTTLREVRDESCKHWIDEERKADRICATRYPVIMVHGVFFRDFEHLNYWGRVPAELEKNGAVVYYGGQQSAASVARCGAELAETIRKVLKETGADKVNVIAHSKGGLDSRYAVAQCGMAPYVASLTTINTPHRGCEFADYLLSKAPAGFKDKVAAAYNKASAALGDQSPDFIEAVTDLTASRCSEINGLLNDDSFYEDAGGDIYRRSYGSKLNKATSGKFPLNFSFHLVKYFDGANDGLVGEKSFVWGRNFTFLTNDGKRGISHADMIDLNRENIEGFDIREFYVQLLHELKERGL